MSDELDRLAEQMQNIRPSNTAREKAFAAAMAAYDAEFQTQSVANSTANESVEEKKSDASQGLRSEARLTEQTALAARAIAAQNFGRDAMSKIRQIFTINPKVTMMLGSCAAAIMVGSFVYMQDNPFEAPAIIEPVIEPLTQPAEPPAIQLTPEAVTPTEITPTIAPVPEAKAKPIKAKPVIDPTPVTDPKPQLDEQIATSQNSNSVLDSADQIDQTANPPAPIISQDKAALVKPNSSLSTSSVKTPPPPVALQVPQGIAEARPEHILSKRRASVQGLTTSKGNVSQLFASTGGKAQTTRPRQRRPIAQGDDNGAPAPVTGSEKIAGLTLEQTAPEFEIVTETVVVQEASTELVTIPATYETVTETVVVQEASTEFVTIPARLNPDGTVAVPATTQERAVPAVTKQETRRVVKTPASTQERIIPAITKEVEVRVVAPPKFILRDDRGQIVREFESRDAFERYQANLPISVQEKPVSTFSVDVDTASYSFMRAAVYRGKLPPPESIRLEEMINYFPYDYDAPKSADEPFKANITVTPTPWNTDTKLMHIGIKGYVPPADEKPNSNLVFLIDTSGSMRAQNKLPLLVNSFKLLLDTLDKDDTVSIVTYAGSAGTVLEPTPAHKKIEIKAALENLRSGGSTAGAAGLELAYNKAQESFDKESINRVILATDGDFNVGFSSPDEMKRFIEKKRKTGIFLSVLGFGQGNYNDHLMQSLAQNGNGVAAYIDTLAEAQKVLANEAGSALIPIAKDVKIQVEFNPATIAEYRLIGYETRALKRQDFNNDKVDAGEINSGHTVTAIYELTPVGSPAISVDKLRYVAETPKPKLTGSEELAFVKIRHKLPSSDTSTLQTFPIGPRQDISLNRASDDMRFATAVAAVGQKLRGDTQLGEFSYKDAIEMATQARGEDEYGYRAEFIQLIRLIDSLDE